MIQVLNIGKIKLQPRKILRGGLAALFLALSLSAGAQLNTIASLERFDEKNGMPFSAISQIVQDKVGYMWFAGLHGICRYDGYNFKAVIVNEMDSTSVWNSEVFCMALHVDGSLLTGHSAGKISILNPRTGKAKRLKISNESNTIRSLYSDSKGNIWVATYGSEIYRIQNNKPRHIGRLNNFPKMAEAGAIPTLQLANNFYESKLGTVWVATNNGLYTVANDTIHHVSHVSNDPKQGLFVHNILSEGDSIFWLPTYGDGIVRYEIKSGNFKSYTFEKGYKGTYNIVYNATWRNRDEIWLTSWGLTSFNIRTRKFSFYYDRADLSEYINSGNIFCDYNGTVWMATNGVTKYTDEQNRFQFHPLKVDKSDNGSGYFIHKVLYDSVYERTILATQLTEGLFIFDKEGNKTVRQSALHPKGEPYQIFYALDRVKNGKILALSRDELLELTPNNQLIPIKELAKTVPNNKPPSFARFLETKNGDWYVGSYEHGLFQRKNGQSKWTLYNHENSGLANNRINSLVEDGEGFIWLSHPNDGLSRFNSKRNQCQVFKHVEGDSTSLLYNGITQITLDLDGTLWIATPEGISLLNTKTQKFKALQLSDGSRLKPSYRLAADDFGNMWVTTSTHVVMVRPDFTFRAFGMHDGLKGYLGGYKVSKLGYNLMQLSTYQGYFSFRPSELMMPKAVLAPVVITEVKSGNTNLTLNNKEPVIIGHNNNHISISFGALNFLAGKNKYQYRMVDLDNRWSGTDNPTVTYSGMPPGNFTFQARMIDNPTEIVELKLIVTAPFYKTWWFRVSLILIGISGIFTVYRIRLNQIRKEEKLKGSFNQKLIEAETKALKAQMSPHFIFNSLNSINRYIVKNEPEKASTYLTKFSKLIRLILDNSNHKLISLDQELLYLKLYIELEALRFNDKFTYAIKLNPELNPMSVGVPPMIIQPFIENAIWHGLLHKETTGHLEISIERFDSGLQCIIQDNGVGRKRAGELKSKSVDKEKSYGMQITKERLDMLNGNGKISNIDIIDLEGANGNPLGTKVIVRILSAELEPEF